jgi:predicted transcriptional regulator
MLHWADLTDDELAECPAAVRDTIERLTARANQTVATLLARPKLSRETAQAEGAASMMRWAKDQIGDKRMQELLVHLVAIEVLRRELAAGRLERVHEDGVVEYRQREPDGGVD